MKRNGKRGCACAFECKIVTRNGDGSDWVSHLIALYCMLHNDRIASHTRIIVVSVFGSGHAHFLVVKLSSIMAPGVWDKIKVRVEDRM